jgi:prepilin-type N-terminal cleavage/methylation domain-containing protein
MCLTRFQRGFTLVELLVVAVIAAILMGLVMAALAGAQQDAYVAKTRATIRKIDSVIQQRYEEYLYAPVEFAVIGAPAGYNTSLLPTQPAFSPVFPESDAKIHSRIRLQLIRDLMCFEMPDCPGDIIMNSGGLTFRTSATYSAYYSGLNISLSDSANYSDIRSKIISRAVNFSTPGASVYNGTVFTDVTFLNKNFNAELLFLIVESSYIGGSYSIEAFANSEIGDTDGDGLREFIDAWGRPIQWLRWPTGYNEDTQLAQSTNLKATDKIGDVDRFNPDPANKYIKKWDTLIDAGPTDGEDPFDPNKVDLGFLTSNHGDIPRGILRPLIVSAGSDGLFGLRFLWSETPGQQLFTVANSSIPVATISYTWPDPYFPRPSNTIYQPNYNQSFGAPVNVELDQDLDGNGNTLLPIVGVQNATTFEYDNELFYSGSSVSELNRVIRESIADNINNFDETGGSL